MNEHPSDWWLQTPWEKIKERVRRVFTPSEFNEWLKRPDIIARSQQEP